ncbi:hypothetical protein SOCE26_052920 [Sorangium cellulosum]|uniref:Secreted protein n=1 Tax=Sorangium cellulosum TaxID=56 RepID=A0A2L0EX20_SORCE|nr:hypothetical protein [Sorangium cellulosum]AUX43836.1 hypothetical protein SOCE26_052920 [Sorangium cellulosum]
MLRRAALHLALVLALLLLAGAACLSPTLPLPPPEPADTMRPSATAEGVWQISGNCMAGARVSVFNQRTQRGVIEDDVDGNGRYHVEIEAEPCDTLFVWQELIDDGDGQEQSESQAFLVEERTPLGVVNDICP